MKRLTVFFISVSRSFIQSNHSFIQLHVVNPCYVYDLSLPYEEPTLIYFWIMDFNLFVYIVLFGSICKKAVTNFITMKFLQIS